MSKTATIRAREEPSLKEHVERIFEKLGLNAKMQKICSINWESDAKAHF